MECKYIDIRNIFKKGKGEPYTLEEIKAKLNNLKGPDFIYSLGSNSMQE
jgi:hypothetical protein